VSALGEEIGKTAPTDTAANAAAGAVAESLSRDAEALPSGPDAVVKAIAAGTAGVLRGALRGNLSQLYEEDVLRECRQMTTRRYPFDPASSNDLPLQDFGRLFGYGGLFDGFFKTSLSAMVDTSRRPWVWRRDESGNAVGGGGVSLERFQEAETIREAFFRRGEAEPELTFQVTPVELDRQIPRMLVEIEGQPMQYRHDPPRTVGMKWPGPTPGKAQVLFGETPVVTVQGPWALFRLLDAARVTPQSDLDILIAFEREARAGSLRLVPSRLAHPFAKKLLQQFRCS
jgi:type VI secretion system protein ImpL